MKIMLVLAFAACVACAAFAACIEITQDHADALYTAGEDTDA